MGRKRYIYSYNKQCTICNSFFTTKRFSTSLCSRGCISKAISQSRIKYTTDQETQAITLRQQGIPLHVISKQLSMGIPFLKKLFRIKNIKLTPQQYNGNVIGSRWKSYSAINPDGTKGCSRCKQRKHVSSFAKNARNRSGYCSVCKDCKKQYYIQHHRTITNRVRVYRHNHLDKIRHTSAAYYRRNTNTYIQRARQWAIAHPERRKEIERKSRRANLAVRRFRLAEYRAKKRQATPPWLSDAQRQQIKEIYLMCPVGYHVDHIVPIQGDDICGLHVPWNLRCIPAIINESKSNRSEVDAATVGTCHQYLRRTATLSDDLKSGAPTDIAVSDFALQSEPLTDEHREFIKRYEWLGNIGFGVKWVFTARYNQRLGGVVMMSEPTSYSSFGHQYEVLIQRGACAAWTPKGLASRLISWACKWMLRNTTKRLFIGYADSQANEIGTIYQACNFDFLGSFYGASMMYQLDHDRWVSARYFTRTNSMKRWARELGIEWLPQWTKPNGFQDVKAIPKPILKMLRDYGKLIMLSLPSKKIPPKGKYALLLWRNKYEKRKLLALKNWHSLPYPKRNM